MDWSLTDWITSQANVLHNIARSLVPVQQMLTGLAYLIGITLAFKSIYALKVYGEARTMMATNASLKEPLSYMAVAAVFIYFPTAFETLMITTFGYSNVLAYSPIESSNSTLNSLFGAGSTVGRPLALLIQTIGLISFIRGWMMIARASGQGQQPGATGKGIMHVFGGILAMNIVGTLQIINKTLYG